MSVLMSKEVEPGRQRAGYNTSTIKTVENNRLGRRLIRAWRSRESVGLAPIECLVAKIRNDLEEHQIAQPAEQSVANDGVSGTRAERRGLHNMANKHGRNEVFTTFKGADCDPGNFVRCLRLVGFFKLFGKFGLDFLLVVKARAEDAHWEDGVNLDVGSRSRGTMSLGIDTVVHLNFLAEGVRQRANGSFGRRVRPVAGNRSECQGGAGKNEMSPWVLPLLAWVDGSKPAAQSGMGSVSCGPVDGVHLLALNGKWDIGKEARVAESSAAPDDIRRIASIPGGDFADDTLTLIGICEVGADVEEALLLRI